MSRKGRSPRWRRNRLRKCLCAGYWFPHRKGGGACLHGARAEYHAALRNGASRQEAEALLWADKLEGLG